MEEILKTTLLEFEKSAFIIDLVEHNSGKQYIRILQSIHDEKTSNSIRAIKINPSLLSDFLKVLNNYQELIPDIKKLQHQKQSKSIISSSTSKTRILTESDKTSIQNRYLKGVSIPDLTLQFDCDKDLIEQVLRHNNITIIDNNLNKSFWIKKYYRKKYRSSKKEKR